MAFGADPAAVRCDDAGDSEAYCDVAGETGSRVTDAEQDVGVRAGGADADLTLAVGTIPHRVDRVQHQAPENLFQLHAISHHGQLLGEIKSELDMVCAQCASHETHDPVDERVDADGIALRLPEKPAQTYHELPCPL